MRENRSQIGIDDEFQRLLTHLHRGGEYAYWWSSDTKATTWFKVGEHKPLPSNRNVYFGINPSKFIPKTNAQGKQVAPDAVRSRIETIAAVNCVFADIDAKDFGSKEAAYEHVCGLSPVPSVIVDSGGGYHLYWLLKDTFRIVGKAEQDRADRLQKAWTAFVHGDDGAKDMARVLRVPGTLNAKPVYKNPLAVKIIHSGDAQYTIEELEHFCGADKPVQKTLGQVLADRHNGNGHNGAGQGIDYTLEDWGRRWLNEATTSAHEGNRNHTGFWLACQLRDSGLSKDMARGYVEQYQMTVENIGETRYTKAEAITSLNEAYSREPRDQARSKQTPVSHSPLPTAAGGGVPSTPTQQAGAETHTNRLAQGTFTDSGNADRLVKLHGQQMRHVHEWGWVVWDGQRWNVDKEGLAMRFAKDTARSIYREAENTKSDEQAKLLAEWASKSLNRARLESMLSLAESELPARPDEFDANPMLLCVENGVVDLRTGELMPARPEFWMTKMAGTYYDPDATAPTWERFLNRIMDGNQEMIAFLQRSIGYSMTGDVREQVLFFMHGAGQNGKSTLIKTIIHMMGDYGKQKSPKFLVAGDRHPTELADIQGARFLATVEVEDGEKMAEVMVKQLTGGDRIEARFMHKDSFEFDPSHKIWLAANHKPEVTGQDFAIWRRIKLIPFSVVIPEAEKDPKLFEKLVAELPGILNWAIKGCLEWQRIGLSIPDDVVRATNEYRSEMDLVQSFLDECCVINPMATATGVALHEAYVKWARQTGEDALTQRKFTKKLREHGLTPSELREAGSGRAIYYGIGLRAEAKGF